jgi:molybdate transport system substrate-binding protein
MRNCVLIAAALLMAASSASAAEITVLTAGAMQEAENAIAASYEKESGNTIVFTAGTVGQIQEKLKSGAPADVIVVSTAAYPGLEAGGAVAKDSGVVLGRIGIGVGVKDGAAVPDISTPEKFKTAMLKARSVTYMNPAQGASSGIATAKIMKELGIGEAMAKKTKLTDAGYAAVRVASGEVDMAIQNVSEIVPVKGVKLAGPLPAPLQVYTSYEAGVAAKSANAQAAAEFIRYLARAQSAKMWTESGVEPAVK